MEIFLYIIIFIMGTFFGSFFTLAVYRIPLKKDITHERSFCPNCNHRLELLDLFPVLSYIFLRGKCRYCGEKVRIRYLLLEVLSGLVFVISYHSLNIEFLDIGKIVEYIFFIFMYVTLVLVSGIDKEYRKINSSVLCFGGVCQILYILYLYMIEDASMYRYSIYFAIFILLFVGNLFFQKKSENYGLQILVLCAYILAVLGGQTSLLVAVISCLMTVIMHIIKKEKIPVGFVISISAICVDICLNFIQNYII